jgi:Protein of unknown function (DUF998)
MIDTPLVRRPVHTGGLLLLAASLQFVVVMILTAARTAGTTMWTSSLSTLAAAPSPWGTIFEASLTAFGGLAVIALLLVWSSFDELPNRGIGILALLVGAGATAAAGVLLVSSQPLSYLGVRIARDLAVVAVGVGLVVVSFAMQRPDRWRISRPYTLVTGAVILGAGALLASGLHLPVSSGVLERLALFPALLWPIVEGAHIVRLHRFAPGLHLKVAAA